VLEGESHKQGVAAGLGIALISRVAIDMELETKRLVMLDVEGFPITSQWYLIHLHVNVRT
jgi:DNA-binding transcriptional LysR family regulator